MQCEMISSASGQEADRAGLEFEPVEVERLAEAARRRLSGRIREFRLIVNKHGLVLLGHAPSYYLKQLAQHAIMEATEVPIVANRIEVPVETRAAATSG